MRQLTLFDEEELTGIEDDAPDFVRDAWRKAKKDMKANFQSLQELPYEEKIKRQEGIAREFYEEMQKRGHGCHVSVGGLDSIVLLIWLKSIGINVKAISVSAIEDKSIQEVHKALGVEIVKSYKSKVQIINEVGFPVISKRIAGKISMLQNPSEDNRTVRHAIITGECGEQGHFAKNSRMKLPNKWLRLFGGYENENENVHYGKPDPDILVSNECCYWLKEKPCDDWAKEHNSFPYLGLMASEGGQREEALVEHGCNYYGATVIRSAPFAIFMRDDLLRLAIEMNQWYQDHLDIFEQSFHEQPYGRNADGTLKEYIPLETIIPGIYGEIESRGGKLCTTKAQRTGCSMCGFGIHLEKRPHRFDRLREQNEKEWHFWMYECCTDPKTGEKYGWGRVLNYIGVEWEDRYIDWKNRQIGLFDRVSALGEPLVTYPEDSLLTPSGCGKDSCYSCCSLSCQIRIEDRYCRYATIGNPFPCVTIKNVPKKSNDCQFINNTLAFHRAGDGRPVPCCMKCENKCDYRCKRSIQHYGKN